MPALIFTAAWRRGEEAPLTGDGPVSGAFEMKMFFPPGWCNVERKVMQLRCRTRAAAQTSRRSNPSSKLLVTLRRQSEESEERRASFNFAFLSILCLSVRPQSLTTKTNCDEWGHLIAVPFPHCYCPAHTNPVWVSQGQKKWPCQLV